MTSADDLTETDEEILDELRKGARTKGALVDATGRHRNTVGHRLDILEASGHIAEIHDSTALYELNNDPREEIGEPEDADESDLRARLQNALEARDDAQAMADRLEEELQDCQEQLQQARADDGESVDAQLVEAVEDAHAALQRAENRLPDDVPGETAIEDARMTLERAREAIDG